MGLTAVETRASVPAGGSMTMRHVEVYWRGSIRLTERDATAATAQAITIGRQRLRSCTSAGGTSGGTGISWSTFRIVIT